LFFGLYGIDLWVWRADDQGVRFLAIGCERPLNQQRNSLIRSAAQHALWSVVTSWVLGGGLFPTPVFGQSASTSPTNSNSAYQPITGKERARWAVLYTIGPKSLAAGVISAGWGTAFNSPEEYGTSWEGFAKRYGMRLTGVATGNAIEASAGAIWKEDPRYFRAPDRSFMQRVAHAGDLTFRTRRADGKLHPAYARYAGNVGNNFLSNTWRVESESTVGAALSRIAVGFAGKFGANLFDEFWPTVRNKLKKGP
jgi:hypothetical protein